MEEVWLDIFGYEGFYMVSNCGNVKSLERKNRIGRNVKEKLLEKHDNGRGYLNVNLSKDGVKRKDYIHRLVATAFISNPNNLPQVNHKDENKDNNQVDNLEWCDNTYNNNYGNKNKITSEKLKKVMLKEGNHFYGKHHSEETKKKISEKNKGNKPSQANIERLKQKVGSKNHSSKKAVCDEITFECIVDCAEYINEKHRNVCRWLSGDRNMPQKYKDRGLALYEEV